ncbi:hypothetical protein VNO78_00162 [Psophocarpus tetragonolobus]|uniref:Uncharacterized protein n=1 Tax=Psophocarpus tetragonolobus TaxID=3891 RepID=A0AAN9SXR0_PSOTE
MGSRFQILLQNLDIQRADMQSEQGSNTSISKGTKHVVMGPQENNEKPTTSTKPILRDGYNVQSKSGPTKTKSRGSRMSNMQPLFRDGTDPVKQRRGRDSVAFIDVEKPQTQKPRDDSKRQAHKVAPRLGFDNWDICQTRGPSDGIW